jgi:hypothetical protein
MAKWQVRETIDPDWQAQGQRVIHRQRPLPNTSLTTTSYQPDGANWRTKPQELNLKKEAKRTVRQTKAEREADWVTQKKLEAQQATMDLVQMAKEMEEAARTDFSAHLDTCIYSSSNHELELEINHDPDHEAGAGLILSDFIYWLTQAYDC